MGHKMLCWYPWVPIGGLMGINCAILTYNGTAFFGFTGDVHAAPDLKRLEKFVDESFAELRAGASAVAEAEVGAKPQRQKRVRPNGKIPVANAKTPVARKRTVRKRSSPKAPNSQPTTASVAAPTTSKQQPEKVLAVGA
jgi:hypothetical protein